MKSILQKSFILRLFVLFFIIAGARAEPFLLSNNSQKTTDEIIVQQIKLIISADKSLYYPGSVKIFCHDNVVSLVGRASTGKEASQLAEIADSIKGVRDIDTSKLIVQESSHPLMDTLITLKVKTKFLQHRLFGAPKVPFATLSVETTDGTVYLSGQVANQTELTNAIKIAHTIQGVKHVEAKININGSHKNTFIQ
jgi:hyperosmotically inducible protein